MRYIITIVCLLFLTACSSPINVVTATPQPGQVATSAPTIVLTDTSTATVSPTMTASPTLTDTPTATHTPMPSKTLVPTAISVPSQSMSTSAPAPTAAPIATAPPITFTIRQGTYNPQTNQSEAYCLAGEAVTGGGVNGVSSYGPDNYGYPVAALINPNGQTVEGFISHPGTSYAICASQSTTQQFPTVTATSSPTLTPTPTAVSYTHLTLQ